MKDHAETLHTKKFTTEDREGIWVGRSLTIPSFTTKDTKDTKDPRDHARTR
jgi:hypothetical protein